MKQKNKRSIFDDRRITLVASVLLAVLAWIIVAGFINPSTEKIISGVKIDYTQEEETYKVKGLQIVDDLADPQYTNADVKIASDSAVGAIGSADVAVTADYSRVSGPGIYEIPLVPAKVKPGDYRVTDVSLDNSTYSLKNNPKRTVTLTFEPMDSQKLTVEIESQNITAAEGYVKDTPVATPSEVTITGPESELVRIAHAVAVLEEEEVLDTRKIYSGVPLTLRDTNGHDIDQSQLHISLSTETVEVEVPIMERRTLNLGVAIVGQPQNFDMDWLMQRIVLSTTELQVLGEEDAFSNIQDPYIIATYDISELTLGWESDPITIELPANIHSVDPLKTVTATFDSAGLVEKTFEVKNLTVINGPVNGVITPIPSSVAVTLIGPQNQIDALLPEDIVVQIDAFNISAGKSGEQTIPARVLVPSENRVFATGNYSVVCNVEAKSS